MEKINGSTTQEVYNFIKGQIKKGEYPSVQEIMAGCDIKSKSVVVYHLRKLQFAGLITRSSQHRSIRLRKGV
jgi:SOS-response transcriptional repressor LexA